MADCMRNALFQEDVLQERKFCLNRGRPYSFHKIFNIFLHLSFFIFDDSCCEARAGTCQITPALWSVICTAILCKDMISDDVHCRNILGIQGWSAISMDGDSGIETAMSFEPLHPVTVHGEHTVSMYDHYREEAAH